MWFQVTNNKSSHFFWLLMKGFLPTRNGHTIEMRAEKARSLTMIYAVAVFALAKSLHICTHISVHELRLFVGNARNMPSAIFLYFSRGQKYKCRNYLQKISIIAV